METVFHDIRYAVRSLLKRPGFTLIAVITLALGIGVNTALFTGFNIFLRPKPVKDPASVVKLQYQSAGREEGFSYSDYSYLSSHSQVLSDVIADQDEKLLIGEKVPGAEPEEVRGSFVSSNYLSMLGGGMRLGKFFDAEEDRVAGRDALVVLGHRFWQRRFGGDPQIIGRSLLLNGKTFTVIGVTSSTYVGLRYEMPDVWLPLMMRATMPTVYFEDIPPEQRDWFGDPKFRWLNLHARLRPGKTIDQARAEMDLLRDQLARTSPSINEKETIDVTSLGEVRGDNDVWGLMAMVLGASGLVLLIACFNIANMQMARAASRGKEIGLRLCLGASRRRLVRQLLTESLLLAGLGGAGGVLLAWWSLDLLMAGALTRYGGDVAHLAIDVSPDARVLGFSLLLAVISGIAFGLAPALRATRPDLVTVIKQEGANSSAQSVRSWRRNGLVVAQVSLSLLLLIPAGLLMRGLQRALSNDPGFETKKLLSVGYSLELSGYDEQRAKLFQQQLMARLSSLPGVQEVSLDRSFGGRAIITSLDEPGTFRQFGPAPFERITANYLQTIGTPLQQGRGFTAEEVNAKASVVIISESTARNIWPGQSPLGRHVKLEQQRRNETKTIFASAQVIGVARDNQINRIGETPAFLFYLPEAESGEMDTTVLAHTTVYATALKEIVRKEAYALEPVLRLHVSTAEENIAKEENLLATRAISEGTSVLGGLALLLAAIGIYGVMAWSVAQRTREMGIRMALGAQRRDVLGLVLKQGMKLVLLGLLLGLPAAWAVMQLLKGMLFGLSTADPVAFSTVIILLTSVALTACYIPARRATRVDPLVALRYE